MTFACEEISATTGHCLSWVEVVTVPPLTTAEGLELSAIVVGCWATAYAVRFIVSFILNRR